MSDAPPDALGEIFNRLPTETVLRCRSVCKSWLQVIDGESFVKFYAQNNHDSRSSTLLIRDSKGGRLYTVSLDSLIHSDAEIDATPIKKLVKRGVPFLGALRACTCNGLILLTNFKTETIWNPMTGENRSLPDPGNGFFTGVFSIRRHFVVSTGFGYDHTTEDYKVVRTYEHYQRIGTPEVVRRTLVYSLKSGRWRMAKDYTSQFSLECEGVYLNGRLHFISRHLSSQTKRIHDGIAAFDLDTEEYRTLPPCEPLFGTDGYVCALDGCLVYTSYDYEFRRQKVWVLRDYGNGVEEEGSWVQLLNFVRVDLLVVPNFRFQYLNPVAYMESRALMFLQRPADGAILCVDIENKSVKRMLKLHELSNCTAHQFSLGSLFRLSQSNGRVKRKRLRFSVVECDHTQVNPLMFEVVNEV